MSWFTTLRSPRRLMAMFIATIIVPAAALAYLAWLTLEQDRALERQHIQERLESVADDVALGLEDRLKEIARQLTSPVAAGLTSSTDSLLVSISGNGIIASPPGRILYYPAVPSGSQPPPGTLEPAESLEYQNHNYAAAAAAYRGFTRAGDPAVRAAAWIGLARCLRRCGRPQEALAAYDQLAKLDAVLPGSFPAELFARKAACELLAAMKSPELAIRAVALYRELQQGRWRLDRATFQLYSEQVRAWLPESDAAAPPARALALADAVEEAAVLRQRMQQQPGRGRIACWLSETPVLIVWENTSDRLTALATGPGYFEQWKDLWKSQNAAIALSGPESHPVLGKAPPDGLPWAVRSPDQTGLPWTLQVASADIAQESGLAAGRRRVVLTGLAVVGILIVAGGFLVARARAGELAVARMQSDFVAAVSHEFRSPLTSMRHLLELLEQGDVPSEERRQEFYRVLSRETMRLHRLVEHLLNFRRLEDGKAEYQFESVCVTGLVESVAEDFAREPGACVRLTVAAATGKAKVIADREAIERALWNLLDNAAKYSPDSAPIRLEAVAENGSVFIQVRDRGPGIPQAEQKEIFRKFYRGADAKRSGVKGTGIGLATVACILRAHRGEVLVDSRPGEGSTFTIVLPLEDGARDAEETP
jgi:signal transduction histidine kinase/tetratricopeptide (TPR) repeat protein